MTGLVVLLRRRVRKERLTAGIADELVCLSFSFFCLFSCMVLWKRREVERRVSLLFSFADYSFLGLV